MGRLLDDRDWSGLLIGSLIAQVTHCSTLASTDDSQFHGSREHHLGQSELGCREDGKVAGWWTRRSKRGRIISESGEVRLQGPVSAFSPAQVTLAMDQSRSVCFLSATLQIIQLSRIP